MPSARKVRTVNLFTSLAILVISLLVISMLTSKKIVVVSTKLDDTTTIFFVKFFYLTFNSPPQLSGMGPWIPAAFFC